jgi:hypothetical protein
MINATGVSLMNDLEVSYYRDVIICPSAFVSNNVTCYYSQRLNRLSVNSPQLNWKLYLSALIVILIGIPIVSSCIATQVCFNGMGMSNDQFTCSSKDDKVIPL